MATFVFEEEPITCVSLEQELGLARGGISRLTIHPSGAVEIETAKALTTAKQTALKAMLNARGLGFGKKPNRT